MLGLVLFAVLLHGLALPADELGSAERQLIVFNRGAFLGALFAALLGALSITGEFRHGTIRPTLLVTPRRTRVIAAKALVSVPIGAAYGLAGSALATGAGIASLRGRGIDVLLDGGDYALLVVGGMAAAGFLAAIGVGLGAVIRNQVPTLVGICAWLLFVEGLLVGDSAAVAKVGRFFPGAAAMAVTGQGRGTLVAPAVGLVLVAGYAAASAIAGALTLARRDVA
jgi:hypothetical protein